MKLPTDTLPQPLAEAAEHAWQYVLESAGTVLAAELQAAAALQPIATQLPRALACSPFIADLSRRKPELLRDLLRSGELQAPFPDTRYLHELRGLLSEGSGELGVVLRRYRQRHMLRIVWRDLCRVADTLETVRDTSLLAQACVTLALEHCQLQLERRFGVPLGQRSGERQELVVLAMGKLGAYELNVSSDIDLIFAYPESGQTDSEVRCISNDEFFTKAGQALIGALDAVTAEGFVFRVDMRLRPYGDSGALVYNFDALEQYYQDQGRDWERYAFIKARPLTGNPQRSTQLMTALRPFVFRRYIDFSVIESLRSMKQMISAEVRRKGLENNVKLGHGGIREVEFIAQCFQLMRGGRDLGLQQRELLPVLRECGELGCLPPAAVAELRAAYLFLRDTEHALQGYQDRQTQELPVNELSRLALATVMGFDTWDAFAEALAQHRERVARHFSALIAVTEVIGGEAADSAVGLWGDALSESSLADAGFAQPAQTLALLSSLLHSPRVLNLQSEGRERLERFMPRLLQACTESEYPDLALQRVLPLVDAVLRRSAYLVLLIENPPALHELVVLCGASPWIAEQLARNPALLDELLDRASLYTAPDRALLADELRQQVARLDTGDLEAQMDALRYFKASHVLRVAASELAGRLPVMKVSDKLTWIAEVILEHVLQVAWADLERKYGRPRRDGAGQGFAVFGYGKLGGIELGYGSDLDLVFICDAGTGTTDGDRGIDDIVFYTRLGQRMIHILQARMAMGQLYDVDMRLRPSGESGMLVTTLSGYRSYQEGTAWTWEHQALVRARFVAGDASVALDFSRIRADILSLHRDEAALAREVVAMREKMREHSLPGRDTQEVEFHLKQGTGGIVDIEFMVQYAVLAWSRGVPELVRWSDNVRILETLGREGLFEQPECEALTQAYLDFRSAAHQLSLQQQPGVVPVGRFVDARAAVTASWERLFAPYADNKQDKE